MQKIFAKYGNAIAITLAIVLTSITSIHWNEIGSSWGLAVSLFVLGYIFGEATCHFHSKSKGLALSLVLFFLFNLTHSVIDGIAWNGNILAVFLHESVRQPTLYLLLWGIMTPFSVITRQQKILISIVSVTGIWMIGLWIGADLYQLIDQAPGLHQIIEVFVFLLIGDLMHHLVEEITKLRNPHSCGHMH